MSTNATIARYNKNDEKYDAIYCHYDGYLDHLGKILIEDFYNDYRINKTFQSNIRSFTKEDKKNKESMPIFFHTDIKSKDGGKIIVEFFEDDIDNIKKVDSLKDLSISFREYNYLYLKKQWFFTFEPKIGWCELNKDNIEALKIVIGEVKDKVVKPYYDEKEELKERITSLKQNHIKLYQNETIEEFASTKFKKIDDYIIHLQEENNKKVNKINIDIKFDF